MYDIVYVNVCAGACLGMFVHVCACLFVCLFVFLCVCPSFGGGRFAFFELLFLVVLAFFIPTGGGGGLGHLCCQYGLWEIV